MRSSTGANGKLLYPYLVPTHGHSLCFVFKLRLVCTYLHVKAVPELRPAFGISSWNHASESGNSPLEASCIYSPTHTVHARLMYVHYLYFVYLWKITSGNLDTSYTLFWRLNGIEKWILQSEHMKYYIVNSWETLMYKIGLLEKWNNSVSMLSIKIRDVPRYF